MPRLLVCRECRTIEMLPLYDGPAELEADDPMLNNVVARHAQRHGEKLEGVASLLRLDEGVCKCRSCRGQRTAWDAHQDQIIEDLKKNLSKTPGFHPEYYATIDTFKEDAARCYNLHRRPKGTDCIDWRADRKRLTDERREKDKHIYLCDFCPVSSTVAVAIRRAAGMYDKKPGEID